MPNTSFKHKALITLIIPCISCFLLFFQNANAQSPHLRKDISKVLSASLTEVSAIKIWVDTSYCFKPTQSLPSSIASLPFDTKIGDNQYPYWLTFELKNTSADTLKKWLNTSVFDSLTLYQITNNSIFTQERGLLIDYTSQQKQEFCSVWQNKYGFLLSFPPHSTHQYYLRIRNVIRAESSLAAMTLESLPKRVEVNGSRLIYFTLFSGAFFSVLFFLFLFSLVQSVQNRNKSYSFYSLYILFCFLYYWWKFEKSNSFLNLIFTSFPDWYYYVEVPLWSAMYLTYILFVMHFIDTKRYYPLFHQSLRFFIIGLATYVLLDRVVIYIWDLSIAWDLFTIVRVLMFFISIAMIYFVFRTKQQQLGFYVLWGSVLMLTGGFVTIYLSSQMEIHYYGAWDVPLLPMQLGVIIEVFFFFIGLGYKSRLAEREKTIIYQDLKQEQEAAKKMKKRKEFLNRWYTNISHEFRTPLTVIGGMAEQIKGNAEQKNLILKNNKRLLLLVNQILDLSKMETNNLSIHWIQGDVIYFLNYLTSSFQTFAQQQKIMLSFHSEIETLCMDYDPEKLEQIIINLLHNAIKFTPKYGTIKLHTKSIEKENHAFLKISISDTGQGIDAKKLSHIFNRFYQADNGNTQKNEGAGIGLALTKELTKLLGGKISVRSELGKGTTFEVLLPIHHIAKKEHHLQTLNALPLLKPNETPLSATPHPKQDLPLLLLVEDNQDVLHYLQSFLKQDYQLLMATDGQSGIDSAIEHIPDIIISDVMMPEKDGFELCETLQQDRRTSHIPIILLTAKATVNDRIAGLSVGADAYLAKPFNKEELLTRLKKLIEGRQLLQQYYTQTKQVLKTNKPHPQQEKEQVFLAQLHEIVLTNLDNPDFGIPQLCLDIAMSKTQLYRKVKALTGKTVALYIRSVRLNKASKLLKETSLSIGEIAEQVGFGDLSYFSKVFKQEFGISPSESR